MIRQTFPLPPPNPCMPDKNPLPPLLPTCVVTEAAAAVDRGFWVTAGKGGPASTDNECATALCRNMADTKLLRRLGGLTLTGVGGVGVGEASAAFTREGSVALGTSDNTLHKHGTAN